MNRRAALSVLAFLAPLAAQDAPQPVRPLLSSPFGEVEVWHAPEPAAKAPAVARWTLWLRYDSARGPYLDHRTWLEDLQRRFAEGGVRIVVVLPRAGVADAAAARPGLVVTARADDEVVAPPSQLDPMQQLVLCEGDTTLLTGPRLDAASDLLRACADGRIGELGAEEMIGQMDLLRATVGDAETLPGAVDTLRQTLPHSGLAHALAVLEAWWCNGDLDAAQRAIDTGFQALAGETVPFALFADAVLRGDRSDPELAKRFAVELAPVAAAADGPFTQLVYLRALLRSGNDRLAGRVLARVQKRVAGLPGYELQLAEVLMEAAQPVPFRDLAERALAAAERGGVDAELIVRARHKILARCGDVAAANELLAKYREGGGGDLNNDAWYTMVRPDTMGRFDTYALAQCEELQRVEGAQITNGNQDTVALALFLNGKVAEAVELQTTAAAGAGGDPRYEARLRRFREVAERLAAAKRSPGK